MGRPRARPRYQKYAAGTVFVLILWCILLSIAYASSPIDATISPRTVPTPTVQQTQRPILYPPVSPTKYKEGVLPALERPGEAPLSMGQFFECLAARLNVDQQTHTMHPLVREKTIPLVLFPMMLEVEDNRQLICNMTGVNIRYIVYAQNEAIPQVWDFLDDVEAAFGWTKRVIVRHYPEHASFSGAVNTGIREMLTRSAEDVPFMHVSNNDVRYFGDLLPRRLREFYGLIAHDEARMRELEAEVRTEPNAYTPSTYVYGTLRQSEWSLDSELMTSPLLPDRIRYMDTKVRATQFANHTAMSFFSGHRDGSSYFLSRLAASTVGYWDENFYPAYYEDVDYFYRTELLGFQLSFVAANGDVALHYGNAILSVVRNGPLLVTGRSIQLENALLRARRLSRDAPTYDYAALKWNTYTKRVVAPLCGSRYVSPFGEPISVPLDTWVRDTTWIANIRRVANGSLQRTDPALTYNCSLFSRYVAWSKLSCMLRGAYRWKRVVMDTHMDFLY